MVSAQQEGQQPRTSGTPHSPNPTPAGRAQQQTVGIAQPHPRATLPPAPRCPQPHTSSGTAAPACRVSDTEDPTDTALGWAPAAPTAPRAPRGPGTATQPHPRASPPGLPRGLITHVQPPAGPCGHRGAQRAGGTWGCRATEVLAALPGGWGGKGRVKGSAARAAESQTPGWLRETAGRLWRGSWGRSTRPCGTAGPRAPRGTSPLLSSPVLAVPCGIAPPPSAGCSGSAVAPAAPGAQRGHQQGPWAGSTARAPAQGATAPAQG